MSEGKRIGATLLAILAAVALLFAAIAGYATDALFDSDEFAERAIVAIDDEAVSAEIATRVTDDLVLNAQQDLIGARPLIEGVVDGIVGGSVFQSLFRTGISDVHRSIFSGDANTATLTLADVGEVLRGALQALRPQLAKQVPGGVDIEIAEINPPAWLADAAHVAGDVEALAWVLLVLALILAAAALFVSPDRRRTVMQIGVAIVICGVVGVVALSAVRAILLTRVDEPGTRDAAEAIWHAFLGDLTKTLYLLAAIGAVIAAAASSLLRPVDIGAPLRRAVELIARVPERRIWRLLRALALLLIGILIVVRRELFVDLVVIVVGLYVAYAGASELMRMILPEQEAEAESDRTQGRRALIATGVAAGVILIGGALFITTGGISEAPAKIDTVGCNGAEELCDRPLNEVAFPSTHNAMSAVTNPNWLFAQQEDGFPAQLHDGVRGLFFDAHYGTPTEGGQVKTDLSDLDSGERRTYEAELGADALDAALRIRDRLVDSPTTGPRAVYLCHRFCELGALPIVDGFKQIRDFLAANPDEVVVMVIEDYVEPADIDAAVRNSGLIDYVYEGELDPEALPTLQQIIDSGGRALIMAEDSDGGSQFPYYHSAYDALVQETPYSFKDPKLLSESSNLRASCKPNRGPDTAPLFLINHWIDTSPAPKPSNAAKVNSRETLLARLEQCEKQRGLFPNFVSVDFFEEGDLFEVIKELNAEQDSAGSE